MAGGLGETALHLCPKWEPQLIRLRPTVVWIGSSLNIMSERAHSFQKMRHGKHRHTSQRLQQVLKDQKEAARYAASSDM